VIASLVGTSIAKEIDTGANKRLRDKSVTRILIADDQRDVLEALRILLKGEGYQTEAVTSLVGIFNALDKKEYALLLMDLNYTRDTTSGQEGLSAISKIQAIDSTLPIVVMTAWATIELAVDAMKRGARDFVTKPWDNQRLVTIVRTQIELASALRRERKLEAENEMLRGTMPDLIAQSPVMRPVIEMISRVAPSDANVLITGENGTGKSLIARAIHALSPRASRTMITVNMGGLSETLFESELFGHVKGAFTDAKADRAGRFELADESTLFLDEIANIPLAQQAKLLRVIETGDFERVGSSKTLHANVRTISATNANLENEVAASRFRQDLLFRLNTIQVVLPPLRDRREDIMPLANSFLRQHAERYRKQISGFDEAARERLLQHAFTGNVRELDHIVERAVLMTQHRQIGASDLGLTVSAAETRNLEDMSLEDVEAFLIKKALARNDGNARKAAEALGLSRSAFYRRLQQYGL
jgi:DNA-binding NtrC family response regulator